MFFGKLRAMDVKRSGGVPEGWPRPRPERAKHVTVSNASATEAPSAPEMAAPGRAASRGWFTVYMTAAVAVMSQIDRGILALFVQPMKRDFHLTDTQVSILLGFAFTFFYVVGGPPLSRMADRGVRKSVIAGCLAVWSLATAFCGIAQSFWAFFAARAVIGGTESGCGPASLSMIADAVPREKLPRAYAIYNSGFLGGQALSLVIGGVLLGLLAQVQPIHLGGGIVIRNWQLVFIMLGIPGLLIAALVTIAVPEPARKGAGKPGGYPMREVIGFVVSQRALHVPLLLGVLCMTFQTYGLLQWMPAFYERTYGWGPATIGPLLGVITLVCSTAGLFGGARIAEILGRRRDDANLRILFLAQSLSIPLLVIGPLMPNPWLALGCNAVGGMIGAMGGAGYNAALNVATPNAMRSQINVMYFILMNAIAGSLGPTMVALVTDYVARSEADLRYVISGFRLVLGPLTAFFMWRALGPYARVYRQRVAEGV
jgi:MFS family permease